MSSTQIPVILQWIQTLAQKFLWTNPMTPLSQLHLSPLLSASATPPLLLYFLYHRLLLSWYCLNPDRHCLSVVMTTIWRSLSVGKCCTDVFFTLLCVSPKCRASLLALPQPLHVFNPDYFLSHSCSHADVALQRWEKTCVCADRNQWVTSHEILLFHLAFIIFLCDLFLLFVCFLGLFGLFLRMLFTGIVVITAV